MMQQEETSKKRRIRQISVKNLFGIFNHTIPLNMDERITIIHGPNGFGKTMILKLLYALFSLDNQPLYSIPFDEFRIYFEDGSSFWINRGLHHVHSSMQEITFYATGERSYSLPRLLPKGNAPLGFPTLISELIPTLDRIGPEAWRYILTGEILSLEDILERFGDRLPGELVGERPRMPEWLVEMRRSVPIRLIETQRLRSSNPSRSLRRSERNRSVSSQYAVTEDSQHLVDIIRRQLAEYASLSQSLDRTFPARLISPTTQQLQVEEQVLLEKLEKLEAKRSRLMANGLLDQEPSAVLPVDSGEEKGINSNTKAVLAVYAEDTEQKLGILDELAQKIDLLITIINNRFLYKRMSIDKEQGLVFTSKNGTVLPLEDLSSGEQHELVLFYELLFRITPGSLVLIDEPELSLHVVWQEHFLKDVQQVTQLTDIDIVLATHSPDIISDRRDLVVELEAPKNGRV